MQAAAATTDRYTILARTTDVRIGVPERHLRLFPDSLRRSDHCCSRHRSKRRNGSSAEVPVSNLNAHGSSFYGPARSAHERLLHWNSGVMLPSFRDQNCLTLQTREAELYAAGCGCHATRHAASDHPSSKVSVEAEPISGSNHTVLLSYALYLPATYNLPD